MVSWSQMQKQETFVVHIPGRPLMSIVSGRRAAIREVESVGIITDGQRARVCQWLEGSDAVCDDRDGIMSFIIEDSTGWEMAGIAPCVVRE